MAPGCLRNRTRLCKLRAKGELLCRKRKRLSRGASPERLVKILAPCEVSFRRRLVFLLFFCLLLRCHEGSSVNDFPLQRINCAIPIAKSHPTCGTGSVLNTRYCGSVNAVSTELCKWTEQFSPRKIVGPTRIRRREFCSWDGQLHIGPKPDFDYDAPND
jgi:hypothetical protein